MPAAIVQSHPTKPPIAAFDGANAPDEQPATMGPRDPRHLGKILLDEGAVSHAHLLKAIIMRRRQNVPLGQILLAQGWVTEEAMTHALTRQWRTSSVDPATMPPDARLIDALGAAFCLKNMVLPWRRVAGVTFVATSRPEDFEAVMQNLTAGFGPVRMLLATESGILGAIMARRSTSLIRRAEQSVPENQSCRGGGNGWFGAALGVVTLCGVAAPRATLAALTAWVSLTLLASLVLKILAFCASLAGTRQDKRFREGLAAGTITPPQLNGPLPVISVMVPLFHEDRVAEKLIARLSRLDYPRELTDILLVAEESDEVTQTALKQATLPHWISVVSVPPGPLQTKPRALNYALNFCRGDIIGIWDAEDRPDPDQLYKVARGFAFADSDVVCLQGRLDYFNPRSNWLARCFTIEYASWFRTNLPGIARLGLVVPLGGTTVFLRRNVLEEIGAWDAWNVTEDADLGVRLARRGWRTELIDTTTDEEANCRVIPWIKQRSRWLKGYAATWAVHMRDPAALWRDLGPMRFLAFQVQFLGTLSQYLLAPVLWSFWLLALHLPHPIAAGSDIWVGGSTLTMLIAFFVLSEITSLAINLWSIRGEKHRHLWVWTLTLPLYFPLGCLAAWKAIYETIARPFYWDKTVHGIFEEADEGDDSQANTDADPRLPVIGQIGTAEGTQRSMQRIA